MTSTESFCFSFLSKNASRYHLIELYSGVDGASTNGA